MAACGVGLIAVALALAGLGILLWSFYDALAGVVGGLAAEALAGLLALLGAGLCAWLAKTINR